LPELFLLGDLDFFGDLDLDLPLDFLGDAVDFLGDLDDMVNLDFELNIDYNSIN